MRFSTGAELLRHCEEQGLKIHEVMLQREQELAQAPEEEIKDRLRVSLEIMKKAVEEGLQEGIRSLGGLIGGDARRVYLRQQQGESLVGPVMSLAVCRAMAVLEVNGAMGKIVAAPTAGSSGIIPGTLLTVAEARGLSDEILLEGLLTAGAVGLIITKNATVAGAEGGCQAETGAAAAMAAAAMVEMMGGTPEAALHGAAMAIKNVLGLVCDPIAGLVEAPCEKRNAIGAANALISAEMALAGVKSIIPFDEVVSAMYAVGRCMPFELRETALGGLANTPTGRRLQQQINGKA